MFKMTFLIATLIGLDAQAAAATGFEVPMMPDFSLQRKQAEQMPPGVDRDLKTGSIGNAAPRHRAADPLTPTTGRKHRTPPAGTP
jgi:hypothetical protein